MVVRELLRNKKPMTPQEIVKATTLSQRAINFALRRLLDDKLVKKIPNLFDMRCPFYCWIGDEEDE